MLGYLRSNEQTSESLCWSNRFPVGSWFDRVGSRASIEVER